MKKVLSTLVATVLIIGAAQLPSKAEEDKKYSVGLSATFLGDTTGIGVNSRFSLSDNISIRPFISFLGSSGSTTLYLAGASATYDFKQLTPSLTPYGGIGYGFLGVSDGTNTANLSSSIYGEAGVDYSLANNFLINGNYKYFFAGDDGGALSVSAGYRF
jgi:outer membrane protein W